MKNILCYGASNTWGFVPGKFNIETMYMERYSRDVRWTGRLQTLLGNDFYIIEEGLNGRTTNLDLPIPPDRNGKNQLLPILYTHSPLDLIVLMLGFNDLRNTFNRSAKDITSGVEELIQLIQSSKYGSDMQSPPKILLIGHPEATHDNGGIHYNDKDLFKNSVARSKQLDPLFSELAKKKNCYYLNMAPYIRLSDIDGIHLDKSGHKIFADLISVEIKKILGE